MPNQDPKTPKDVFNPASLLSGVGSVDLKTHNALEQIADQCPHSTTLEEMPIRTIHHLSCTGGTLFTKCLASMPNVVVLNEINPFSRMQIPKGKPPFTPTDIVALVRQGEQSLASDAVIKEIFLDNLAALRKKCWLTGRFLVLRDHSHSQFLHRELDEAMPTLREVILERFPVLSVVTTRSVERAYASMERNGWHKHFTPSGLEEYKRRCQAFYQRFEAVERVSYEDMVERPMEIMRRVCDILDLEFFDGFQDTFSAFNFSGDSGRGGNVIRKPAEALTG